MIKTGGFLLDGKPVRCWLFCRMVRVETPDGSDLRPVLWQVEGFDKDHALTRLVEHHERARAILQSDTTDEARKAKTFPGCNRGEWEILEELDPSHDVGLMGSKLPLLPVGVVSPSPYYKH